MQEKSGSIFSLRNEIESLISSARQQQRTQAGLQVKVLTALEAQFGPVVGEIVERTIAESARETWAAHPATDRSIHSLVASLWEPLRKLGFEFTAEETEQGTQMHCTACPLATLYLSLGAEAWGYRLYCSSDACIAEAFNPRIGMRRTKTLMQGNDCCDHFYHLTE